MYLKVLVLAHLPLGCPNLTQPSAGVILTCKRMAFVYLFYQYQTVALNEEMTGKAKKDYIYKDCAVVCQNTYGLCERGKPILRPETYG